MIDTAISHMQRIELIKRHKKDKDGDGEILRMIDQPKPMAKLLRMLRM